MARRLQLSRRAVLRGAGTLIGLPVLEAMRPLGRAHAQGAVPRRFVTWFFPNGYYRVGGASPRDDWTPMGQGAGAAWSLSPILQSLSAVKSQVQVLSNLSNPVAHQADIADQHIQGTGSFLSCVPISNATQSNGATVDQVAARTLGRDTRFPSLVVGADFDFGGSSFATTISWSDAQTPIAKQTRPEQVFDRLFLGPDASLSQAELAKRKAYRKSVLDSALESANRLHQRLGVSDQRKLDEYLTSVRELELRVRASSTLPSTCTPGARPVASADTQTRIRQMLDVLVLAFRCDLTRVASFMFDVAGSDIAYPFLTANGEPIEEGHHTTSHHQDRPQNLNRLQAILTWHVEQLAYFLGRLQAESDASGSLLDNSIVFFSSDMGDGNLHEQAHLPVVVAGRGGGALTPDKHLVFPDGSTLKSELFITLLQALGVSVSTFGQDGTKPLTGLG